MRIVSFIIRGIFCIPSIVVILALLSSYEHKIFGISFGHILYTVQGNLLLDQTIMSITVAIILFLLGVSFSRIVSKSDPNEKEFF